jgi:ribonuclease P protein component
VTGNKGNNELHPFRPSNRLHQPNEFAAVMASSLRLRGGVFELRYRRNENAEVQGTGARLGLVIPKRLARRAVLRNQIKRLAREAFRQALPTLPAVDIVLRLIKPPLLTLAKVDRELRHAWRRDIDSLLAGLPQ